ncbi:hypothetical protein F164LOC_01890 [Pectobacterium carotovorum]|nr:hypothetical protein F164LOC_01890 [Pectobacterium carotovorum]
MNCSATISTLFECYFSSEPFRNKFRAKSYSRDPAPKFCAIQKQNSDMIHTSLNGGGADEKTTIHRREDCLCP